MNENKNIVDTEEVDLIDEYIDDIGYFYEDEYEKQVRKKRHNIFLNARNIVIFLLTFFIGVTVIGMVQTSKYKTLNDKYQIVDNQAIKEFEFFEETEKCYDFYSKVKNELIKIGSLDKVKIPTYLEPYHKAAYNNYMYLKRVENDIPEKKDANAIGSPSNYHSRLLNAYELLLTQFFDYEDFRVEYVIYEGTSQPIGSECQYSNYYQESVNYLDYTYNLGTITEAKIAAENSMII